jgi:hypothetical protein
VLFKTYFGLNGHHQVLSTTCFGLNRPSSGAFHMFRPQPAYSDKVYCQFEIRPPLDFVFSLFIIVK